MINQIEELLSLKEVSDYYLQVGGETLEGSNAALIKEVNSNSHVVVTFEEGTYKVLEVLSHEGELEGYLPIGSYKTLGDVADSLVALSQSLPQVDTEEVVLPF